MNNDDSILLHLAVGWTLVDITQTNVVAGNSKQRNQQRNFEAVLQCLGLRTQLLTMSVPEVLQLNITNSRFGSNFTGSQAVWTFKFGVEQAAVYSNSNSLFGALEEDFTNVPVILGLDESVIIPTHAFCVSGPDTNTYFESIRI
jgi:hypothetical protein